MTDLLTRLRTASSYRMREGLAEQITAAAVWQQRQAQMLEEAAEAIERLAAENRELKERLEHGKQDDSGADR